MAYPFQDDGPLSEASLEAVAAIMGATAFENLTPEARGVVMTASVGAALVTSLASIATSQETIAAG